VTLFCFLWGLVGFRAGVVIVFGIKEIFMSNSFIGDRFSGRRGGNAEGWPANAIWEAMDQLRGQYDRRSSAKKGKPDVRAAVLALLAEKPMHGYEVINEIAERSGGAWKPSAGAVYPVLQLLTDEGLITGAQAKGRTTYSITDAGREFTAADSEHGTPWEAGKEQESRRSGALAKVGFELAQAAAQVGRSGKPEQVKQAVAVLEEARRALYSILAQG